MEISPRSKHNTVVEADNSWLKRWEEELEKRQHDVEKNERNLERNRRQMLEEMKEKEREIRHRMEMVQRGPQSRHKEAQTDESIAQRAWDNEQARR